MSRQLIDRYAATVSPNIPPIRVPLDLISNDLFDKKTRKSDGENYWQLGYNIVLEVKDGGIWFWIEIGGQQFGKEAIH